MYGVVYVETCVFLASALIGGGQLHSPATLPLGKELQYPMDRSIPSKIIYTSCKGGKEFRLKFTLFWKGISIHEFEPFMHVKGCVPNNRGHFHHLLCKVKLSP
jgi:hypothetical protein